MRRATATTEGSVKTGTGWRSTKRDHPVPRCRNGIYFFSVSSMIRLTSVAALLAAALVSPPWIATTMAAPMASRHSATATTGGFHSGVPTLEPTVSDSRRSAGTLAMPLGSFQTDSRAPRTPFSLCTASTCSLAVAHCIKSHAACWFWLVLGIARPHAATVAPCCPLGPRGKTAYPTLPTTLDFCASSITGKSELASVYIAALPCEKIDEASYQWLFSEPGGPYKRSRRP